MNHYPRPVGMFFRLAINKEKSASLARIDDLPEEAAREKEIFRRFGPQSSAIFLFKVGGKIIGAMAFGSVLREREWTDDVVNRLRLLVEIIGNAIARTRVEERTREALEENRRLRQRLERESCSRKRKRFADLRASLGKATPFETLLAQVGKVAATNSNVLLTGETGTGKEMLASAIHELILRGSRPVVRVSCAAIADTLEDHRPQLELGKEHEKPEQSHCEVVEKLPAQAEVEQAAFSAQSRRDLL